MISNINVIYPYLKIIKNFFDYLPFSKDKSHLTNRLINMNSIDYLFGR